MTDRGKEHLVFDIVVPGLLFVACILAALLIMAMITTPAHARHCHEVCSWTNGTKVCTEWCD